MVLIYEINGFLRKGAKLPVYFLCTEDVWLVKEVCRSLMGLTEINKLDFLIQDNKQPKYSILLFWVHWEFYPKITKLWGFVGHRMSGVAFYWNGLKGKGLIKCIVIKLN
jgi:hypothetical protein